MSKFSVSNDLHVSSGDVCALLPRCGLPPPPLAAALALSGDPDGAAATLLACQSGGQGWLDGPGHTDRSLGGRGFAPTPNPEPTPLGGGIVQRSDVTVIYINIYVCHFLCFLSVQYAPLRSLLGRG